MVGVVGSSPIAPTTFLLKLANAHCCKERHGYDTANAFGDRLTIIELACGCPVKDAEKVRLVRTFFCNRSRTIPKGDIHHALCPTPPQRRQAIRSARQPRTGRPRD